MAERKKRMERLKLLSLIALLVGLCFLQLAQAQEQPQHLKLAQKIPLPRSFEGRIDHQSVDVKGNRYFMSGLGNGTVEVIDLASGKVLHTIPGFTMAQAALYVPETNLIFVADGESNFLNIYDGTTYELVRSTASLENADNLRYVPANPRYGGGGGTVMLGYGEGATSALRIMNAAGKPLSEILLEAHPESFQVDTTPGSFRVFVNINELGYIAVADTNHRRVMEKWQVPGFKALFPMAFDEKDQRLFIASRNPPALVVLDSKTGKVVTSVEAPDGSDALWYDAARKRIYMSAVEGVVGVFEQRDADHYALVAKVPSVPGSATSYFAPALNRLFVPAPPYQGQPAQVLVYEVQP
jgi:DNA-binding beta-propeller fold protein YncE